MPLTPSFRAHVLAPLTAAAAIALALTGALPASAAPGSGKGAFHETIPISGPDVVCGVPVTASGSVNIVEVPQKGGSVSISIYRQRITFTAANGRSVTTSATEVDRYREVKNPDGTLTITFDILGSPERISVPGHGIVTLDAGRIRIVDVINPLTGEPVVPETVTIKGPHPEFDSQFELGCNLIRGILS